MFARILSWLFPPKLPSGVDLSNWVRQYEGTHKTFDEQGSARLIPTPPSGIEKHFSVAYPRHLVDKLHEEWTKDDRAR